MRVVFSAREIAGLDDINGMKLRINTTPAYRDFYQLLGAAPTPIPTPAVFDAMSNGQVDGLEADLDFSWNQRFDKVSKTMTVVQATGGTTASFPYTPELCASAVARAIAARCVNITAPAVVRSPELLQMLLDEPLVREQFATLARSNRVLFGISSLRPNSTIHTSGFFESVSLQDYLAAGAVGVVAGRFIDERGRPVAGPLDHRTVGISLDLLRRIGTRIAVAGGFDKVPALLAALRGGYVNVLITDAATGHGILRADGGTALDSRLSHRPKLVQTLSTYRSHGIIVRLLYQRESRGHRAALIDRARGEWRSASTAHVFHSAARE